MPAATHVTLIGTGGHPVSVELTAAALEALARFSSLPREQLIAGHRELLTTITVGKVAAGGLVDGGIVVEVDDIADLLAVHPRPAGNERHPVARSPSTS